jgi:hypothetical protein
VSGRGFPSLAHELADRLGRLVSAMLPPGFTFTLIVSDGGPSFASWGHQGPEYERLLDLASVDVAEQRARRGSN